MFVCAHPVCRPPVPRLLIIFGCVHIFQNQFARIDPAPLARIDKIQTKLLDSVRYFPHAPCQGCSNWLAAFAAVNRGQRLDPALGSWNDSFAVRAHRTQKQPIEPFSRKVRQVAGDDQIPGRVRCGQSGRDSCQRTSAGLTRSSLSLRVALIRDRVKSQRRISAGRSDNCDLRDQRVEQSGCMEDQRDAAEIEKSLVTAHTRAGTPRKNKGCDLAIAPHVYGAILRLRSGLAQRSGGL